MHSNDNLVEGDDISDIKLVKDTMDEMTMVQIDYCPFIATDYTNYKLYLFPQ